MLKSSQALMPLPEDAPFLPRASVSCLRAWPVMEKEFISLLLSALGHLLSSFLQHSSGTLP